MNQIVASEIPTIQPMQRMRIAFTKEGDTRYISHLDVARALERALNRAGLPVAHSQGFNRRPKLSLAAALPLGYTGEAEIADVWLVEPVTPDDFLRQLAPKMPPGIAVTSAVEVPLTAPSLQQQMTGSIYSVHFLIPIHAADLEKRVESVVAADQLIRERTRSKTKRPQSFDLRPLILDLRVESGDGGNPLLHMRLVQTATQTGKPDDVLAALGIDPLDARVHRLALQFADSD